MSTDIKTIGGDIIQEPQWVHTLLNDARAGWLWLVLRVWLGWNWIEAGWHKLSDPAWVGTGEAVKGYWQGAIAIPETGRPAISFDWYRSFLTGLLNADAYSWMGPMIAYGEVLVGVALVVGAFTGIAAFFGGLMNWNFMMAGSASSNPMLFIVAISLILAWKVAGYYGADYFLLRRLGTPWHGARLDQEMNAAT